MALLAYFKSIWKWLHFNTLPYSHLENHIEVVVADGSVFQRAALVPSGLVYDMVGLKKRASDERSSLI